MAVVNGVVLAIRMAHPERPDATLFDDQFLAFFSSYMTLTFVANGTATGEPPLTTRLPLD